MIFNNANEAYNYYYQKISNEGELTSTTKRLRNVVFTILNPMDNEITNVARGWKKSYANIEWDWYLSRDRKVTEIKKVAKIWDTMHDGDDVVNSNYGYQWNRKFQLSKMINELRRDKESRRSCVTIYDGKERHLHSKDTPCTLNICFSIVDEKLFMTVVMRSNDLWFGFCNDQYCFSKLQETVADSLGVEVGNYTHIALDLHLYYNKINKKS